MIVFNDKFHGQLISNAIPRRFNPISDVVISNVSDEDGRLLGGVTFDGFTNNCIFIHQAGFDKHWLSKTMLWAAFDYPFNQLKVAKLAGTIPEHDKELLDINRRLGFNVECRIRDAYGTGDDMLILSMTREECRWLNIKQSALRRNEVTHEQQ